MSTAPVDAPRLPIEAPPEFIPWEPTTPYEIERNKPMPSVNHSRIQLNLCMEFARQREFSVYPELDVRLEARDFTPDVCVYPHEPFRQFEDVSKRTDAPLLIVEILSNSQGAGDVYEKIRWYLAHGVKSAWMISPLGASVTIYGPNGSFQVHPTTGAVTDPVTGIHADFAAVMS